MDEMKSFIKSREICNLSIVIINIVVFIWLERWGSTEDVEYMLMHGAAYAPWIFEYGEYTRLFTSMFLHFGINHIIYNMLVLVFLGNTLEHTVGKIRYLIIYLGGGVLANLLSNGVEQYTGDYAVSAGASGAIFSVVGALIYIVLVNKGRLENLTGKRLILMAGLILLQGFTSIEVDNMAHVGGLIFGFLLAVLLYRKPKKQNGSPIADDFGGAGEL